MDNALIGRIEEIAKELVSGSHPGAQTLIPKLNRLKKHVEQGGILGPEEFRFLDFYEKTKILSKCKFISPLWECRLGIMEHCKHRVEWEQGENTCQKYTPER